MAEDLRLFAARLARFDPSALIRLTPRGAWASLPWGVLVQLHATPEENGGDRVVYAVSLLDAPAAAWRGALPPPGSKVVERVPVALIKSAAAAAAETLREVSSSGVRGRAVGPRVIRDVLLDHNVITGTSDADGTAFAVSQRLVQAIVRMGLLEGDPQGDNVDVLVAGHWTGLGTSRGSVWHRASSPLKVRPLR
jgi:hypothetical protein